VEEKELYVMNHIGGSSEGSKRDNTNNLLGHLYSVKTKEFLDELKTNMEGKRNWISLRCGLKKKLKTDTSPST
jgi:hypothetical protein